MTECHTCTRPTADNNLCHSCTDQLAGELRAIPWLVEQLEITLTRQARTGQRNGPRSTETALAYHLGASIDLETLHDGLHTWAATVAHQRGIRLDTDGTTQSTARWLLRWIGAVTQHPDAAEIHGDITTATKAARRTIDLNPELRYVGPCEDCGADLYVGMHASTVTCRTDDCGAEYPIEARRIWLLEQAIDQLRTAAQLSRELPWIGGVTIDRKRINQWSARGQITKYDPHPHDEARRPRYRVGDVIQLAHDTLTEPAKSA